MRDKVVQQSLAAELNRLYDSRFSDQTYAYRSNKSSLDAVNAVEERIQSGKYLWILKVDILHFFDEIDWKILSGMLGMDIKEEDVLFLIEENAKHFDTTHSPLKCVKRLKQRLSADLVICRKHSFFML